MNFTHLRKRLVLLAAVAGICTLGIESSPLSTRSAVAAVRAAVPHRLPTHTAAGAPRLKPYAATPHALPVAAHRPANARPLHEVAATATKHWEHTGWVRTGAIERHHFWLTTAFDHDWHTRLYVLRRERFFWWRHHHLYNVLWLGQGWNYYDWWLYHHSSTRPSNQNNTASNTVADNIAPPPAEAPAGRVPVIAEAQTSPSDVALRNQALNVLGSLDLTDEQMAVVQGSLSRLSLAGDTVDSEVIDSQVQDHPGISVALSAVYQDMLASDDDKTVADQDKLLQLEDRYQLNVDPTVVVSDDACVQAKVVFDSLTPKQIAAYLAIRGNIVPDPVQILLAGLDQGRHIAPADFDEFTRCLARRIAVLQAGFDDQADQPIIARVTQLLAAARPLSDEQFEAQKDRFRVKAQTLLSADPIEIVAHAVQWDLANFMANPQAKAMLDIRSHQPESGA